jgi:dipeptidase
MSLDITLYRSRLISYDQGKTLKEDEEMVYNGNITHNLGEMASKAGIYKALWRPASINAKKANDIVSIVEKGLEELKNTPEYFKQFNSPNGWGIYEHFLPFVEEYLKALKEYPDAIIVVDR